jgi:hypothetical protein
MSYTIQFHEETANITPKEASKIIKFLAEWQEKDKTPGDGTNRFGGVAYDHDRNALRVTAYVESISGTKAPEGVKTDFDPLVEKANKKFGSEFGLPSDVAEIQPRQQ